MAIHGFCSKQKVKLEVYFYNGHISVYTCFALDLAVICKMLDREKEFSRHSFDYYKVKVNGEYKDSQYFNFSDQYSNWKI